MQRNRDKMTMEKTTETESKKPNMAMHNPADITEFDKGLSLVDRAMIFAVKAHMGSKRKGSNTPYIVHPMEAGVIAAALSTDFDDAARQNIIAAAILHDVLEDTAATPEYITEKFGSEVLRLIKSDSEDKRPGIPSADSWQVRKQETIDFVRDKATLDEKIIIFSDKLSNLRSIFWDYRRVGEKLWDRFNMKDPAKHAWYYSSFADLMTEFRNEPAYIEYKQLLRVVFGAVRDEEWRI